MSVTPEGGSAGAGGGTPLDVEGVYHYSPTQAETNYTAFTVTAYKASCIPVSVTVVTTASATAGKVDVDSILGTAVTEGGAGRLAAAFTKLYDVATPLLVASDVMRGTDIAATAAKLLAYVQLVARSDEAIETDNSTEVDEINADGGSGVGGFMNDSDSLQAIRDRGDSAWLTGAGNSSTASYTTADWTRTTGDNDGGAGSDAASVNGTYFSTGETAAGAYLQVEAVFTIGSGEFGNVLDVWGFYDGGGAHFIQVLAKDTVSGLYEPIGSMPNEDTVDKHSFTLSPGHTDGTTVTIRFLHQGGNGNASHVFSVDKAQVNAIEPAEAAPTAASIVDEWETQSQADPTRFHVNVLEVSGTSQTANDNGADINAILADTNELQTDNVPGLISALNNYDGSDTSGVTTLLTRLSAVRAAVLTDWINGGRLDLILDSIGADTTEIAAIKVVTDAQAADGSGQTAIPWNSSWDAEVQSEVNDALVALHLDHLLAADYDPASKPGVATALLNEIVENDGGVSRFTVNALEQAPSGSGGDASAANQVIIVGHLTDIKGAGWSAPDDTLKDVSDAIDLLSGATGSGADLCTINIKSDSVNVPDADVWITSDANGQTVVAGTLQTNANGNAVFLLDDGATYYLWAQKDGVVSIQGESFSASKDT